MYTLEKYNSEVSCTLAKVKKVILITFSILWSVLLEHKSWKMLLFFKRNSRLCTYSSLIFQKARVRYSCFEISLMILYIIRMYSSSFWKVERIEEIKISLQNWLFPTKFQTNWNANNSFLRLFILKFKSTLRQYR